MLRSFGGRYTDYVNKFCLSPSGIRHAFANLLFYPLPGYAARSFGLGMPRGVGELRNFQGHAKELKGDGGVINAHSRRYARLHQETLASHSKQIFTLSIPPRTVSDKRNDLLCQVGEI